MLKKIGLFLFSNQTTGQIITKNAFWLTISNVVGNLLRLVIIVYAARLLGATEYGFFSYAISIVAIFAIISDLGLNSLISINIVQREKVGQLYFSTLVFLRFILVFITIILAIIIGPIITRFVEAKSLIWIVTLLLVFDDTRSFLNNLPRSENRNDKDALVTIITNLIILILCWFGLKYAPTSRTLAIMYLVGSALGTFITFIILRKGWFSILKPFRFSFKLAKDILAIAIPFSLANAMWTIMVNTDVFIISWLKTPADLGYYAAAQKPVMMLTIIPHVLVVGSISLMAKFIQEENQERLKNFIEKLITFSLAIVLPLVIGGIITAPSMMNFLYGTEYNPAILSFQLLLVTLIITYSSTIISNLILIYKQQKTFTIAMVTGALVNIGLDLLLIPSFGIAGSVIATIGALAIIYGYLWYKIKQILPFKVTPFLPRIVAATVIMGTFTFILNLASVNFFINIVLSAVLYLGILIISREPLLRDLRGLFR